MKVLETTPLVAARGGAANYTRQDIEIPQHVQEQSHIAETYVMESPRGASIAAYVAAGLIDRPPYPLF